MPDPIKVSLITNFFINNSFSVTELGAAQPEYFHFWLFNLRRGFKMKAKTGIEKHIHVVSPLVRYQMSKLSAFCSFQQTGLKTCVVGMLNTNLPSSPPAPQFDFDEIEIDNW